MWTDGGGAVGWRLRTAFRQSWRLRRVGDYVR